METNTQNHKFSGTLLQTQFISWCLVDINWEKTKKCEKLSFFLFFWGVGRGEGFKKNTETLLFTKKTLFIKKINLVVCILTPKPRDTVFLASFLGYRIFFKLIAKNYFFLLFFSLLKFFLLKLNLRNFSCTIKYPLSLLSYYLSITLIHFDLSELRKNISRFPGINEITQK